MSSKQFLDRVRAALGHQPGHRPAPPPGFAVSARREDIDTRAQAVRETMRRDAATLLDQLAGTAAQGGWKVFRAPDDNAAASYILSVTRDLEPRPVGVVRSAHDALERLNLEAGLKPAGVTVQLIAGGLGLDAAALRQKVIDAGVGVTGADYAIAETGSCVLIPRAGVSRIVSLVPPVHIAVVEKGSVLPTPDDLFALRRRDFHDGNLGSHMNIISGPSRSADIEYTLITGVHGPGEVHMVLLG
ncbi:MAG: hypothetical protein FJ317_04335 [SAR202 cluster bacterium]|nr:hypothetical protein [SAR202 cluster bacterium]